MNQNPIELAYKLRPYIEKGAANFDDKDASQCVELYPKLQHDGSLIEAGTRINWHRKLKQAKVALWDTIENDPDHAPTLWDDIEYYKGYRYIEQDMPATKAFKLNECGWWKDKLYKSLMNGNVYTPETAPTVWELVEEG